MTNDDHGSAPGSRSDRTGAPVTGLDAVTSPVDGGTGQLGGGAAGRLGGNSPGTAGGGLGGMAARITATRIGVRFIGTAAPSRWP